MSEDNFVKVVGTSLDTESGIGGVTIELPQSQLSAFGLVQETVGSLGNYQLGERYGLRTDEQALSLPSDRKSSIVLARELYKSEPLVATVIDLMIDFCMTGMENRCEDQKSKRYFDNVCKYGDFDSLHRQQFKEYFLSGDVFNLRGRKRTVSFGPDKGEKYYDYTVLNPLFVEVSGPLMFNEEAIGIMPNDELKKLVKDKNNAALLRKIPAPLKKASLENRTYYPDQSTISRFSRKRSSYERYATPFLTRVFEPVLIKRRMREADLALSETVRNVLVTFTIGDKDHPATQFQLDSLAGLLQSPVKSMDLIWNHTLKVEYHFPDADLFNEEKYKQVNLDILQGLGIPPVLIDGGGGTFATAWTSLLSVIEKLETVRNEVERWQENEYRIIAETEGLRFKDIPSVYFKPMNLRDDKVFKNLLLELYKAGLLSIETLLSLSDFDMEVEFRNRKAEMATGVDKVFVPRDIPEKVGRPTNKVDPGNYESRDKTPEIDDDSPDSEPSTNVDVQ